MSADRDVLLRTHNAAVISALRYGETAYGSPTKKKAVRTRTCAQRRFKNIDWNTLCHLNPLNPKGAVIKSHALTWEKAGSIYGIRIREKPAHSMQERLNTALRNLMYDKPHLPVPLGISVGNNLCSYGPQDIIIISNSKKK
jgi:hypothetical protein